MDSAINTVVSLLCTPVVEPIYQQINYLFHAGANVKALKKEIDELKTAKGEVERKIAEATARADEEVPTDRVQKWLKDVQAAEVEVTRIEVEYNQRRLCFGWCALNCWSTYNISKQAAAAVFSVKDIIVAEEKFGDAVTMRCAPTVRRMLTLSEASPAVRSYLEMALEYLQDDSVGIIGIYGMGGVGKTSLLQRINNHPFVAAVGFDYVIWLVASQDLNINKLQNDMAQRLGLRLRDDASIEERGQSLYCSLKQKKFLLLLDDIWERVDLEKLGITFPTSSSSSNNNNNGAPIPKVVFTTRSEAVCDRMMAGLKLCGRKVKVECMQPEEAWQLFLDNVGHEAQAIISSDERVHSRAKRVADKCGGLPLALIVIGQAMSSNKTLHEWEDAINSIEKIRMQEMWSKRTDPFPLLKISYDRLPSESMRKCFLRCALWPEDASIDEDDLISCWIGMDLIEEYDDDVNAAYSRGHTIIQWLKRAGLLEEVRNDSWLVLWQGVKLHDIIRGMALWIASDYGANKNKWIVPGQATLMGSTYQDLKRWREAETISMIGSREIALPEHVSCPNLSALRLSKPLRVRADIIKKIPDGFFRDMPVLTYLDLSGTGIKELPPAIGNLVRLRYLNLSWNDELHSLPKEAADLVELKHLILQCNRSFQFPRGLISRLEKLEQLDLGGTELFDDEGEASIELEQSSIKKLNISVKSMSAVERISQNKSISFGSISICELKGVTSVKLSQSLCHTGTKRSLKSLHFVHCLELEEISAIGQNNEEFENLEYFGLWHLRELKKFTWGGPEQGMLIRNIRELVIKDNRWLKNLTWILLLPYLEILYIEKLENLKEVIGDEDADKQNGDGEAAQEIKVEREVVVFSHLKSITLSDLPMLCSFSSRAVAFHRLTSWTHGSRIRKQKCSSYEEILNNERNGESRLQDFGQTLRIHGWKLWNGMKGDGYCVKTLSCWFAWRSREPGGKCLHNVIGCSDVAE